jgi:hypothetical protein
MSNNEINELDVNDIGLKQIMGNRFQDGTKKPMVAPFTKESTNTVKEAKVAQQPKDKAVDAVYSPFNAEPSFTQNLMTCAKWTTLFAGLSILFFYWQQTGQMAPSAAQPCMMACAALVGGCFGKYVFRGE